MRQLHITPVYDLLLRGTQTTPVGLYHLQLATASQLCRLHYSPGSIKAVKARLKTLVDNGYVQADSIPTKLFRSPYYYTLAAKGMHYLEETGMDVSGSFRADRETAKHALFIEHTLELNDVLVSAALLQRANHRYYLANFTHERALKRRPYKATWHVDGRPQIFTLIPDGFLDFRIAIDDGRQRRLPIALEHDRGTEGKNHFQRRIRAYIVMVKSGAYQQHFNVKTLTIAFTTFVGEQRLKQMREWTEAELESTKEPKQLGTLFYFTNAVQPPDSRQLWLDRRWYTPYAEDPPLTLLTNE